VNLIGEHTDYSGGYVLPLAIPQQTEVQLATRSDEAVRAWSAPGSALEPISYQLGDEAPHQAWPDYVQGVTRTLRTEGYPIRGFDLRIESSVPVGSGLASSAALEVGLLRALRAAFSLELDDVQLALLAHRAETDFVGAPVGIMDQMACSLAEERTALFLDTRSLAMERVPIPSGVEIVVLDTGVSHRHASGQYGVRRAECERAAALLGVGQLRDLDESDLPRLEELPEPWRRRARHVITENARVLAAVEAMRSERLDELGQLLFASHDSLREDFEVSIPELDLLVYLAEEHTDVYGARMTGGGFGGAVIALAHTGTGARVAESIVSDYRERAGRSPRVLLPRLSASPA